MLINSVAVRSTVAKFTKPRSRESIRLEVKRPTVALLARSLQSVGRGNFLLYVIAGSRNMPLFFTYVNGRYQMALQFGLPAAPHLFAGCSRERPKQRASLRHAGR